MAVCIFVYGASLSSFIMVHVRICAVRRNNLYVYCRFVRLFFVKDIHIKKNLFEANERRTTEREREKAWSCMFRSRWTNENEKERSISEAVTVAWHDRTDTF